MIEQIPSGAQCLPFDEFDRLYRALTGHDGACRWQHRLFANLEVGRFPSDIELATGLGKTSIIALWVLALSRALAHKSSAVPRRLAYVVDRRVVVDQASEFAEQVRERLEQAAQDENDALHAIATTLKSAGCTSSVVEVSTLRGQRALDTRWRDDPTRPAIIVGTVDMIGSRLLFSAYGRVGPWGRALEAALVGQDCLLVLDEAHLCSPFATTLSAIERRTGTLAPFAVVRMGATMEPVRDLLQRTPGLPEEVSTTRRVLRLLDAATVIDGHTWPKETDEQKVRDRLTAKKRIEARLRARRLELIERSVRQAIAGQQARIESIEFASGGSIAGVHVATQYRANGYLGETPKLHVRVTFDRPVAGPIAIGRGRHVGFGLLWPAPGLFRPVVEDLI